MQNPSNNHSLNGSPVLWGLLGILISCTSSAVINTVFSFFDLLLKFSKTDIIFWEMSTLAGTVVLILAQIVIVLFLLKRFKEPKPISKVWVILMLVLWPLFSMIHYYFTMVSIPLTQISQGFKELKGHMIFTAVIGGIKQWAFIITILITTVYLMSRNKKTLE